MKIEISDDDIITFFLCLLGAYGVYRLVKSISPEGQISFLKAIAGKLEDAESFQRIVTPIWGRFPDVEVLTNEKMN
jgi:dihydrodipicolinate synthase/N-acetylneuraminate lyase